MLLSYQGVDFVDRQYVERSSWVDEDKVKFQESKEFHFPNVSCNFSEQIINWCLFAVAIFH